MAARDALLVLRSTTLVEALRVHGVGRKATARHLSLGLLIDPECAHSRPRRAWANLIRFWTVPGKPR